MRPRSLSVTVSIALVLALGATPAPICAADPPPLVVDQDLTGVNQPDQGIVNGSIIGGDQPENVIFRTGGRAKSVEGRGGNDTVRIEDGQITGVGGLAIAGQSGNDQLEILGGTVNGDVDGGAGNDTLLVRGGTISGDMIGGTGYDTLLLDFQGTADFDRTTNGIELIHSQGTGTLRLTNANVGTVQSVLVENGQIVVGDGTNPTQVAAVDVRIVYGTLTVANNSTLTAQQIDVEQNGTLAGQGTIDGAVVKVQSGGTLSGQLQFAGGAYVAMESGSQMNGANFTTNQFKAESGGTVTNNNCQVTVNNQMSVGGGTSLDGTGNQFDCNGGMSVSNSAQIGGTGNTFRVNAGNAALTGGAKLTGSGNEINVAAGDFNVTGGSQVGGGTAGNPNRVVVAGGNALKLDGGSSTTGFLDIQGDVEVADACVLGGTLQIAGAVAFQPGAVVSPGNSPGTITHTAGNTTYGPGVVIEVETDPAAGQHDQIVAGGASTVTADGATVRPIPFTPDPVGTRTYDFMIETTGDLVVARPLMLDPDSGSAVLHYGLSYTATAYSLTVTRVAYRDFATSPNQIAVADNLQGLLPSASGDLLAVIQQFDALATGEAVGDALNQVGGEPYADFGAFNLATAETFNDAALARLGRFDELRCPEARGLWGQALGAWEDQARNDGRFGYEGDLAGFAIGCDACTGGFTLGLLTGYAKKNITFDTVTAGADADFYNFLVYSRLDGEDAYVDAGVGYTHGWNRGFRALRFGHIDRAATSDVDVDLVSAFARLGYRCGTGLWTLTPTAGLRYTHAGVGSFDERGADALNLTVAGYGRDSLLSEFGAEVACGLAGTWRAEASAEWVHEYLDLDSTIDAALGGGTHRITGARVGADAARLGIGLAGNLSDRVTTHVRYDALLRNRYGSHALTAGAGITY